MIRTGETEGGGDKPISMSLSPRQIPHGITRAQNRASTVLKCIGNALLQAVTASTLIGLY